MPADGPGPLAGRLRRLPAEIDAALASFDFRTAAGLVIDTVDAANRLVNETRPWELARAGRTDDLDGALAALVHTCRTVAIELSPFVPTLAARLDSQLGGRGVQLPPVKPAFPRLGPAHGGERQRPQQARGATAMPGRPQSSSGSPSKTGPEGSRLAPSPERGSASTA